MKFRLAVAISAFFLFAFSVFALAADVPDFTLHTIGDGVWAAIVNDAGKAGGNAGFVVGDDGVAVIDTFEDPGAAKELLAEIRKITPLPIRFVVNTHYHLDHVNGNDVFAEAGARIVAHRNVRAWTRSENLKFFGDSIKPEMKARVESLTLPDVVYDDRVDLYLGSRELQVRYYPGHTGGDSVVIVPDAHVVFCGDLLWKEHFPNLIDASTKSWMKTLTDLQAAYGSYTLVPGHGEVAKGEDLATLRNYFADLNTAIAAALAQGKSGNAVVDSVLPGIQAKYGKWAFAEDFAHSNIEQTEQEQTGKKRVPAPVAAGGL